MEEDPSASTELRHVKAPVRYWFGVIAFLATVVTPAFTVAAMGTVQGDQFEPNCGEYVIDHAALTVWWWYWLALGIVVIAGFVATRHTARRLAPERTTQWLRRIVLTAIVAPPLWWLLLASATALNCAL